MGPAGPRRRTIRRDATSHTTTRCAFPVAASRSPVVAERERVDAGRSSVELGEHCLVSRAPERHPSRPRGGEERAVGAHGHRRRRALRGHVRAVAGGRDGVEPERAAEPPVAADVPDDHAPVARCRVERGAVRAEQRASRAAGMTVEPLAQRSCRHVPDLDRAAVRRRRQHLAVRAERGRVDAPGRPARHRAAGTGSEVDEDHAAVVAAERRLVPRGRERRCARAGEGPHAPEAVRVEQERGCLAARDEQLATACREADEASPGDRPGPPQLPAVRRPAQDEHLVGRRDAPDTASPVTSVAPFGANATSAVALFAGDLAKARTRWLRASRRKSSA